MLNDSSKLPTTEEVKKAEKEKSSLNISKEGKKTVKHGSNAVNIRERLKKIDHVSENSSPSFSLSSLVIFIHADPAGLAINVVEVVDRDKNGDKDSFPFLSARQTRILERPEKKIP